MPSSALSILLPCPLSNVSPRTSGEPVTASNLDTVMSLPPTSTVAAWGDMSPFQLISKQYFDGGNASRTAKNETRSRLQIRDSGPPGTSFSSISGSGLNKVYWRQPPQSALPPGLTQGCYQW